MTDQAQLVRDILDQAQQALDVGDLSAANRRLQRLRRAGLAETECRRMLAVVATRLGLDRPPASDGRERYLVIRCWGAGFWADVAHTVHGLALAEATGRTPIVHWGRECRYRRTGIDEAWRLYFEPVSPHTIATVEREGLSIFPPKWNRANLREIRVNKDSGEWSSLSGLYLLNREEDVAVLDFYTELEDIAPWLPAGHPLAASDPEPELGRLYRRHVRPALALADDLARLEARMIPRRPAIAVHYRTQGPEKILESSDRKSLDIEAFVPGIDRYLVKNADAGIFLMTDFAPAVNFLRERYGDRLTFREARRLDHTEERSLEIHQKYDGVTLGREVVLDVFLAARCDAFVGDGASGVSWAVTRLKDWPEGTATLFRRPVPAFDDRVRQHADPSAWWNPPR